MDVEAHADGKVMRGYRLLPAGDTAIVVELGETIDRQISSLVLALAQRLAECGGEGIVETVPTFRSLMVQYDPLVLPEAALMRHIDELMQGLQGCRQPARLWRLPACYDTDIAPDLIDVAARVGLSVGQVIERHSAVTYHVYMLGFLPGQAYMGDVPRELALARRETPRAKVPAGSLAIASTMTCIFPQETPCGWHLIGRSPVGLWDAARGALLSPGDQVELTPVSRREYEGLLAQAANAGLVVAPVEMPVGAAA
jgi:inhibitor of KinA